MAVKPSRSIVAAEKRALAGRNESQDSQEVFKKYYLEHGVGVTSSSPAPDDRQQAFIPRPLSHPTGNLPATQPPQTASNTRDQPDRLPDATRQPPRPASSAPHSSHSSLTWAAKEALGFSDPQNARHVASSPGAPSLLTRDDALPQFPSSTAPLTEKKPRIMSSQSPTQSNEDRSYEQYVNGADDDDHHDLQSTQSSDEHEHRTLHEDDTGFVNLLPSQFDPPDTAPDDIDLPLPSDGHTQPQRSPYAYSPRAEYHAPPETPAGGSRIFARSGLGQVLPPSQMFGQTQGTSAVKKASPTSSRPSPYDLGHDTISPSRNISSPSKGYLVTSPTNPYVSSPAVLPQSLSRSSRRNNVPTPKHVASDGDQQGSDGIGTPVLPLETRIQRLGREPIERYQPYRKRDQETYAAADAGVDDVDSDFEADENELRRQRARSNKERGSKSLSNIGLPHSSSMKGQIEVPSTNRSKSGRREPWTTSRKGNAHCDGDLPTDNNTSQETVADSQDGQGPSRLNGEKRVTHGPVAGKPGGEVESSTSEASGAPPQSAEFKDTIPETSPPGTSAEPPRLVGEILRGHASNAPSSALATSLPDLSSGVNRGSHSPQPELPVHSSMPSLEPVSRPSSQPRSIHMPREDPVPARTPQPDVVASSQESMTRPSGRLKNSAASTPLAAEKAPSAPGTQSSTLTSLSATPNVSPVTDSSANNRDESEKGSSPALAKDQPRGRSFANSTGVVSPSKKLKTYARPRGSLRKSLRASSRFSSASADEIALSSPTTSDKHERRETRMLPAHSMMPDSKSRLFEGMTFAISFQETDRAVIEKKIRQEGGKILSDGFNSLFEFEKPQREADASSTPVLSSSLKLANPHIGFTALIADGHSRKVKYMQALALGIPCLAPRWINTCIAKREVVPWSSYLLCAGPSTLLGDAIRSRDLVPYDAQTARLADVVERRPKMLANSKVLLVMKKRKNEEKRLPYVFLAQVLGATLVRVHSLDEARAKLREKETEDEPFDWVYIDDDLRNAQDVLFGTGTSAGGSKKRKRQSPGVGDEGPPPKRIRTLNDELVIQSLILGRLIEDSEMNE
ncbi:hypothetical protein F4780DRAFT_729039 [Xylariomycetidae sp. FL0641]|nr:hypothetical protein F4780DRAFT_729039 [Xylariomycetidae sp. FL0641]